MKLQILVPQYNETDEVIKPLLDSIALQQNIDFERDIQIIVCNDGSDTFLSSGLINSYPFSVIYMGQEHKGPGACRNTLLDVATADYIMFCDADDMFLNNCAFWMLFKEMDKKPFDTLIAAFSEETRGKNGEVIYINHEKDSTFVHGKVHRLLFLREQNIRFREDIFPHEDGYFNLMCRLCAEEMREFPYLIYLWKWNDKSVCRSDKEYLLKTYDKMIDQDEALAEELVRRGKEDAATYYATCAVYDTYYTLNKTEWLDPENWEHAERLENRFKVFYKKWKPFIDKVSEADEMRIIQDYRTRSWKQGYKMETFPIARWLKRMEG